MNDKPKCALCGEPMPAGEEMFKHHGYSGNCPKPPLPPKPQLLASTDAVGWLRSLKNSTDNEQYYEIAQQAIDALEASAGEVERLTSDVDALGENLEKVVAERDRLKAALKPRLNAKAIEGLQEILEAMEAMDEREAPFLKTLLDWHEATRKALGDAS